MYVFKELAKAFCITCILLILTINLSLLVILFRRTRFYESVKWMTSFSLAVGDVVLALFPLAVKAADLFSYDHLMPCTLYVIHMVYMHYLIHFVYGVGSVAISVEILLRNFFTSPFEVMSDRNKTILAVSAGILPWFLGLVLVLPLGLSDNDCRLHQSASIITVSVLLPASLAAIFAISTFCTVAPITVYHHLRGSVSQENLIPPPTGADTLSPPDDAPVPAAVRPVEESCDAHDVRNVRRSAQHGGAVQRREAVDHYTNAPPYPDSTGLAMNAEDGVILDQQQIAQQGAMTPPPPYIQHYGLSQSHHLHDDNNSSSSNTTVAESKSTNERIVLLIISIIYSLMVIPNAAVMLNIETNHYSNAVIGFVFWLMIARSIFTPLVMLIHCWNS